MYSKDADRMANSVDPVQTAPSGAWSGSTLTVSVQKLKIINDLQRPSFNTSQHLNNFVGAKLQSQIF